MFLDLEQFCRTVVSSQPSVAMVTWTSRLAADSFVARLGPTLRDVWPGTVLSKLEGTDLDSTSFEEKMARSLGRRDTGKRVFLIYRIEPFASAAAKILNGYRERLTCLRVVILVIRENRRRDFVLACPDLMDWVGTLVARAEDLAPALTLRQVNTSIKRLERQFGMSTKDFQAKWRAGEIKRSDEHWFWNELIAIRDRMK